MSFELTAFLKDFGFTWTKDRDKRDSFQKKYYHPFHQTYYDVRVVISYESGFTSELSWSPHLMTITLTDKIKNFDIYDGLAPCKLKEAKTLIKHILPSLEEFKAKELPR